MTEHQMTAVLRNSSLHVLLMIISKVLARSGYGDVQYLDRRLPRQKSRFGGHELVCQAKHGLREVKVVVKVLRDSVRIRNLDEMAGTVLRMGADEGLIITPFHITMTADLLLRSHEPAVRIGVIGGDSLVALLRELKIGTRGPEEVDYAYFGELEGISDQVLGLLSALQP